jgi:hypothetical protein
MEMLPHAQVPRIYDEQPVARVSGDLSQPATTIFRNEQSTN